MMEVRYYFLIFVAAVSVVRCTGPTKTPDETNITPPASAQPTPSPSQYPSLSSTTPPVYTPISMSSIRQQCLTLENTFRPEMMSEGTIIFTEVFHTYYMTSGMCEVQLLGDFTDADVIGYESVSPNGRWLAYIRDQYDPEGTLKSSQLFVLTLGLEIETILPWRSDWGSISGWLDDERLMISLLNRPPGSLLMLNPFTGEQQELIPTFPDVYEQNNPPGWRFFTSAVYDPTLKRVAYLRDIFSEKGVGVVLWDLQKSEPLWELNDEFVVASRPKWSPDGTQLAVAGSIRDDGLYFELFIVNHEGLAKQMTSLTEEFAVTLIDEFSWSPDGRYIAFWFEDRPSILEDDGLERLMVLDVTTGEITDYCIPGSASGFPPPPIWSPDSQQLVVESDPIAEDRPSVILVDIEHEFGVQIAEGLGPVGWMVAQP